MELVVAISISTILLLAMDKFVVDAISGENQDYNKTLVLSNAKLAVSEIASEINSAVSVEANNAEPDSNSPGAPGNLYSWSYTTSSTLILAVPSKDANGNVIYVDALHDQIYTDDVVYYLNTTNHKLYRRYIANSNAPGNAGETTCPPTSASSTCPSDALVVDDVASLSVSYLAYNSSSTSFVTVSPPTGTEAVKYQVTETRTINGKSIAGSYTTIATLRNR
jgi:hypothetical protein